MAKRRVLSLFLLSLALRAQDPGPRYEFSGFGTLGVAGTDTHQAGYYRDLAQDGAGLKDQPNARMDSRLGVQFNAHFTDTLRGCLQGVSKYQIDTGYTPSLTRAFLAWNPVSDVQLSVGRVGLDQIANAESRDVGYSYLWVRPVVDLFSRIVTNYLDGVDLSQSFALDDRTSLKVQAICGLTQEKMNIQDGQQSYAFGGAPTYSLKTELQHGPVLAKATFCEQRLVKDFPSDLSGMPVALRMYSAALNDPGLAQSAHDLSAKGEVAKYWEGFLSWEDGPIQAQTDLYRVTSNRTIGPPTVAGEVSFGYRLGTVVPYVTYARAVSKRPPMPYLGIIPSLPDPMSQALTAGVQSLMKYCETDQYTWSSGVRWDWRENVDLKVQVDRVQVHNAWATWAVNDPTWNGRAMVFSVTLDFVFGRGR